ncbi:MAG: hypothetical protein JWO40_806 [Candidatus Doudnabacteria bacterium]|nr:hypothetical protein [Candidatus Doudnabacteria bacterium]
MNSLSTEDSTRKIKNISAVFGCFVIILSTFAVTNSASASVNSWQKGVSLVPAANNDFSNTNFKQSLKNAATIGANMATFVVPYYQMNDTSADIQSGWNTPTDATLKDAIDYAHSLGMQATIKIHLSPYYGDSWEAYINPTDRTAWFNAYGTILEHYAKLGQATAADQIIIGNELSALSTNANPDNTVQWQKMIVSMRALYSGALTYNANWGTDPANDEPDNIAFWSSLDAIGLSAYYNLNDDMATSWSSANQNNIQPLQQKFNKPIIFTEVGYRSVDGAHLQPWNYTLNGNVNQQEQANDYNALFNYWKDYSYMKGINIWDWHTDPNAGGNNTDYTIQNKAAQQTVASWFLGN